MRIFFNTDSIGQAFVKPEHVMVFRPFDDVCFIRWDFCLLHHLPGPVTFPKVAKPMRTESYPASFKWIIRIHKDVQVTWRNAAKQTKSSDSPRKGACNPRRTQSPAFARTLKLEVVPDLIPHTMSFWISWISPYSQRLAATLPDDRG